MDVGEPDDPIVGFVTFQKRMLVIKPTSIYEIKLADQIDPDRTNIDIPDTNQKVLGYGADTAYVGRTLLTASELFKERYLTKSPDDCERCIACAFDALKDISAMHETAAAISSQEAKGIEQIATLKAHRGNVSVPSIDNVEQMMKDYVQKADHVLQSLFSIVRVFYPDQKRMFEGLSDRLTATYGKNDPLSTYLASNLGFLLMLRNARNAVEHPSDEARVVCSNFAIEPGGNISQPLIELVHKRTPLSAMPLSQFMNEGAEKIVNIFESLIAGLCDKHEREFGSMRFGVAQFPEGDQGLGKHVRYAHSLVMGGRLVRAQ